MTNPLTPADIAHVKDIDGDCSDRLAIRHECPHCGSKRTRWVRNQWHICFDCDIPFTTSQAIDYKYFLTEEA